ncbi:hypothetical protein EVAR_54198_1 [Eumeta japonica]|uniref:Uncharacterized protein n=1 Tax=Eumeta variegata TaxID=151549 RepID=A0A4C1YGY9_EUMVA|nr:hypothetical protein EVAR_54198_1 [Eumeta japonica]
MEAQRSRPSASDQKVPRGILTMSELTDEFLTKAQSNHSLCVNFKPPVLVAVTVLVTMAVVTGQHVSFKTSNRSAVLSSRNYNNTTCYRLFTAEAHDNTSERRSVGAEVHGLPLYGGRKTSEKFVTLRKKFVTFWSNRVKRKKYPRIREKRTTNARERSPRRSGRRRDIASGSGCGKDEMLINGKNCVMPAHIGSSGGFSSIDQPRRPPQALSYLPPANPNAITSATPQVDAQTAPVLGYTYATQRIPFTYPFTTSTQKPTTSTQPSEVSSEKNYINEPAGYHYPIPAKPFLYDATGTPFSIPSWANNLPIRPPSSIIEPPILPSDRLNRLTINDYSTTRPPNHYSLLSDRPSEYFSQTFDYNSLSPKPQVLSFSNIFKPQSYNQPKNQYVFTDYKPLSYNSSEVTNSGYKSQASFKENIPIRHISTGMKHSTHITPIKPKPEFIFRFFPSKTTHPSYNFSRNIKPLHQDYQFSAKPNLKKSLTSSKYQYPTLGKLPLFSSFSTTASSTPHYPSTTKPTEYHSTKITKRPMEYLPPVFNTPLTFKPPTFYPSTITTPPVPYPRTTEHPVKYNSLMIQPFSYNHTKSQNPNKYIPTTAKFPIYDETTLKASVYYPPFKNKFYANSRPSLQTSSSAQHQGYMYDKPAVPFEF